MAGRIAEQEQATVGRPTRVEGGYPGTTRNDASIRGIGKGGDHDTGAVPRHVRVIPFAPGEPSVLAQSGMGVEVGAGNEDAAAIRIVGVEIEGDDRGDRLGSRGAVILANREEQAPGRIEGERRVAVRRAGGDAADGTGLEQVDGAVGPGAVGEQVAFHRPGAAAVLVHPGADVGIGSELCGLLLGRLAPQADPSALLGMTLRPVPHAVDDVAGGEP